MATLTDYNDLYDSLRQILEDLEETAGEAMESGVTAAIAESLGDIIAMLKELISDVEVAVEGEMDNLEND